MEYMGKKIDTLLRRVSSKSRRAARRARRVADESSSGSDLDDSSPSLTPKCDRKTVGSRRSLHKPSSSSRLNSAPSSEKLLQREEQLLPKLGINKRRVSYFHLYLIAAILQLQRVFLSYIRIRQGRIARSHRQLEPDSTHNISSGLRHESESCSSSIEIHTNRPSDPPSSPSVHEKWCCEYEDADYVSDYSMYSRPRKSINELDMSMDESIAESSGFESGYLSGLDHYPFIHRGSPSSLESPTLSPRGFSFLKERPLWLGRPLKLTKPSFPERCLMDVVVVKSEIEKPESLRHVIRPLQRAIKDDAGVPDFEMTELMLQSCVAETKYVTAVFEVTSGGIVDILEDVINEFNMWFNEHIGLMGIACEVHWSCPRRHRNRIIETRMKEALHWSLRENNRRVLNMKNGNGMQLPLTIVASTTEENCSTDRRLDCIQGVYRRFYSHLLAYQHAETSEWHKPYWSIDKLGGRQRSPEPNPQQFVQGTKPTQLNEGSLVAVNIVALRLSL